MLLNPEYFSVRIPRDHIISIENELLHRERHRGRTHDFHAQFAGLLAYAEQRLAGTRSRAGGRERRGGAEG